MDKQKGDAYILNNFHVVYDSFPDTKTDESGVISYTRKDKPLTSIVYLYGMEYSNYAIPFTVVGYSIENDLAVLKVTGSDVLKNSLAQAVTLGNSDDLSIGDNVFAIGNPLGNGLAAVTGIVSKESEYIDIRGGDNKTVIHPRAIHSSVPINDGNSGGGLFNAKGELVGIIFAKNVEEYVEDISYALPGTNVEGLAKSIIENCDGTTVITKKARLGVVTAAESSRQVFDAEANRVKVEQVFKVRSTEFGSPAYGKLQKGDIIKEVSLGEESVTFTREWQIADFLWKVREGDRLTLTIVRDGVTRQVSITFGRGDVEEVA